MNRKLKKALAITVAAMQIPMLILWKIVYDTMHATSSAIKVGEGGGFYMEIDPAKLPAALLAYSPHILLLAACMALSVWGLVRAIKGNDRSDLTAVLLYGGISLSCLLLVFAFSVPISFEASYYANLTTSEYTFYRYPFGLEINYRLIDVWPLMQSIKYVLLGATAAFSAALCIGTLVEMKKRK